MPIGDFKIEGGWDALLICPDRAMAQELIDLLPDQVRLTRFPHADSYPSPPELSEAPAPGQPGLCFLDVCSSKDQALLTLARVLSLPSRPSVVALLSEDNPDLILRSLRRGASGFLLRPFQREQLESVLRRAVDLRPGPRNAPAGTGKVCCVFPAKGNSGATTIAGNLAQQAKLLGAKKVLLADMDPLTGTLSFVFKLKAQYNLADALTHAGSLDADLWKALVTSYRGIDVLTCPDSPLNCSVETQDPAVVLEYCRRSYEMIFLDGGSPYGEWNLRLARLSDQILLVLTAELPAVYAAQRALAYLDRHGIAHSRIRLVLNRHRRDAGFDPKDIEKALGVPVFYVLPNDHATAQSALLEGKPLSAASQLGKALADLVAHLGNRPSPEPKGASSGGLLSLFTR